MRRFPPSGSLRAHPPSLRTAEDRTTDPAAGVSMPLSSSHVQSSAKAASLNEAVSPTDGEARSPADNGRLHGSRILPEGSCVLPMPAARRRSPETETPDASGSGRVGSPYRSSRRRWTAGDARGRPGLAGWRRSRPGRSAVREREARGGPGPSRHARRVPSSEPIRPVSQPRCDEPSNPADGGLGFFLPAIPLPAIPLPAISLPAIPLPEDFYPEDFYAGTVGRGRALWSWGTAHRAPRRAGRSI